MYGYDAKSGTELKASMVTYTCTCDVKLMYSLQSFPES